LIKNDAAQALDASRFGRLRRQLVELGERLVKTAPGREVLGCFKSDGGCGLLG